MTARYDNHAFRYKSPISCAATLMSPLYATAPARLGENRLLGGAERPLDRGPEDPYKKPAPARWQNPGRFPPLLSQSDGGGVIVCGVAGARHEEAGWLQMDRLVTSQDCLKGGVRTGWPSKCSWVGLPSHSSRVVTKPRAGPLANEGPSCIFVGPLESAEPSRLEALYQQVLEV